MPNSSLVDCRAFSGLSAIHFFTAASRISLFAMANGSARSRRYLKCASVFRRCVEPGWPVVKISSPSTEPFGDHFR